MAYDHGEVIKAKYQSLAAELAMAERDYEAARQGEDGPGVMEAADRMLDVRHRASELDKIAHQYTTSQQPRGNRFGLNQDEIDVANSFAQGDPEMTNDQRQETYARNKARYQQARRDGTYRDDQGRVTR